MTVLRQYYVVPAATDLWYHQSVTISELASVGKRVIGNLSLVDKTIIVHLQSVRKVEFCITVSGKVEFDITINRQNRNLHCHQSARWGFVVDPCGGGGGVECKWLK